MASAAGAARLLDVVVVGAGVMGSATAHALATSTTSAGRPCRVAMLEQHSFGHRHGSSHGASRIIRPVYSQQHYAALMPEAYRRWAALEAEAGTTLYTKTGGLYWGPAGFVDKSGDSLHSHRQTCDALGVEYEILDAAEVHRRWPPLLPTNGWEGLFQPDCGILHADACVAALQAGAAEAGAMLYDGCEIASIEGGDHATAVTVRATDGRSWEAACCVVCAGPWAGQLLRDTTGLDLALQPTQNTVAYWPATKGRGNDFEVGQFPVLISDCNLGAFYGIPSLGTAGGEPANTWKFDRHGGPALAPNELNNKDVKRGASEVAEAAAYINAHVQFVGTEPAKLEPCVYTMTRDEEFIIDVLPTRPNIAIGAGFSGHGFKLAPVVGRILAQLALHNDRSDPAAGVDAETRPALHHWALNRPEVQRLATTPGDFPYVTQLQHDHPPPPQHKL